MAQLKIRISDIEGGKPKARLYRGPRAALVALKAEIERDRRAYRPPGTAIHTPVPPGVVPGGFVPSFLVIDPLEVTD